MITWSDARERARERTRRGLGWVLWSPWRVAAAVAVLVLVVILAAQLGPGPRTGPSAPPTDTVPSDWQHATAAPAVPSAAASTAPTPSASASPGSTPAASSPQPGSNAAAVTARGGDALGRAWVTAYLTRSTRDDPTWADNLAPLSTGDLLADLREQSPDEIGLLDLDVWRVAKVTPIKGGGPDAPISTPTRQVMAFSVEVTDGNGHTKTKPLRLIAFRDGNTWLVDSCELLYGSEG